MGSVELLIVFSMTTLYFAVVPGSIGFDQLMPDPQPFQFCFKSSRRIAALWQQSLGKLRTVIGLYTLDHIGESLHNVLQKQHRGIGAVLFEGFTEPFTFIQEPLRYSCGMPNSLVTFSAVANAFSSLHLITVPSRPQLPPEPSEEHQSGQRGQHRYAQPS